MEYVIADVVEDAKGDVMGDAVHTGIGAQFAVALAAKDADALESLLCPDVDFGALTPRKPWESSDAREVVREIILGTWFAPERRITEILAIECGAVGTLHQFRYRFAVEFPEGPFVIEQQGYAATRDDRISRMRLVCSGFLPAD